MLQTEFFCQMFAQRLDTQTFGGMVSCGDERDTCFIGQMKIWLGYLAGDIGIHSLGNRCLEVPLRTTAAPRHFSNIPGSFPDYLGFTLQVMGDLLGKLRQR